MHTVHNPGAHWGYWTTLHSAFCSNSTLLAMRARMCLVMSHTSTPVCVLMGMFIEPHASDAQVRRHVAEHLYIELLTSSDEAICTAARSSEALRVLAACCWDGDLGTAKAARQQLYPLLGVTPPANVQAKAASWRQQTAHQGRAVPVGQQGSSYQQLVDTAALH